MCDERTALDQHLEELEAALSSPGAAEGDGARQAEIEARLWAILGLPGGAVALVARYRADERLEILRPLAFLLATAVNQREQAQALTAPVVSMIEGLRTPDPWPRLNLCTALQRLMMFSAILSSGPGPMATVVSRFLLDALDGPPPLRATAAAVVADIFYGGHAPAFAQKDLQALRSRVLTLVEDEDELTRKEARALRDFLGQPSPDA